MLMLKMTLNTDADVDDDDDVGGVVQPSSSGAPGSSRVRQGEVLRYTNTH